MLTFKKNNLNEAHEDAHIMSQRVFYTAKEKKKLTQQFGFNRMNWPACPQTY